MSIFLNIEIESRRYEHYEDDDPVFPGLVKRLSDHDARLLSEESEIYFELLPKVREMGVSRDQEVFAIEPELVKRMREKHPDEMIYRTL